MLPFSCNAMLQEPPKKTSAIEALKSVTSLPITTFRHGFNCLNPLNIIAHDPEPSILLFAIIESELPWKIPLDLKGAHHPLL